MKKIKGVKNKIMWAYFASDGYLQVRSIADSRSLSREMIAAREYDINGNKLTWKDYEAKGFKLIKIVVSVEPL